MKKYDNYKDSGIEWLGEIPNHWKVTKLKFIGDAIGGLTYAPNNVVDNENEGVLVLRSSNIQNGRLSLKDNVFVNLEISDKLTLKKGDILICSRNGSQHLIGKNICIDARTEGSTFGAFMMIFRSQYYGFLNQYFNSPIFTSQSGLFLTATINQLTSGTLNNFYIAIPDSIEEQQSIANYLDHKTTQIDTLIAKKEQFISLLQEERTAVINQAVTKGLDPKVKMKDSGIEWLGEIPEHWKLMKIGSLSQCITGYAFKSDNFSFENGIKIIRGDNVTENSLRWGEKTRYWNEYSEVLDRFQLQKNDIVIGMDGSKVGKNYAYVEEKDLPLLLVQRVARIRSNSELIAKWIHFNIGAYNFKYYINLSKTDPAIPHITLKNITSYPICMPDIDELNLIIEKLNLKIEKLDETIKNSQQEIELLKEYKTALISEVVTGKVDVRNEILN